VVILVLTRLYIVYFYLEAQRLATKIKTPIDELYGGAVLNTVICRECLEVLVLKLFVTCDVTTSHYTRSHVTHTLPK